VQFEGTHENHGFPAASRIPEFRRQAEAVLERGETLSGFVPDALTPSIEYRKFLPELIA
jgi:hypothetical protein